MYCTFKTLDLAENLLLADNSRPVLIRFDHSGSPIYSLVATSLGRNGIIFFFNRVDNVFEMGFGWAGLLSSAIV